MLEKILAAILKPAENLFCFSSFKTH